jgi:WD40 repeat protein/tRNA A-37 threonylcarbamoyl transferase component Bud32
MTTRVTCSRGHQWEVPPETAQPGGVLLCPVCREPYAAVPPPPSAGTLAQPTLDWDTAIPPESPRPAKPLSRVGDYEILQELGRGGMGVVLKARDVKLNRFVALKMIVSGRFAGSEERERFQREAESVARLHHPHIVQIYAVAEHDGQPFVALEFVEGGTLSGFLNHTPQPAPPAARLTELLARAIHYAHERGIVHRDLKPGNVLLAADGSPRVADFGLAKILERDDDLTSPEAVLGTPSYMAPEQAAGRSRKQPLGPAVDVYALGAILYEMLTGRPPFRGETVLDTLQQVCTQEPIPPSRLQPRCPRDLETVCLKCLEKEPVRRYTSAGELAEDLRRFQAGEPIHARPIGPGMRLLKWAKRRPALAALAATTAVFFLSALAGALALWQQAERAGHAETLRAEAEAEGRRKTEAALAQAEKNLYFHDIALADREWRANHVLQAQELLDRCPAELRGWEWNYLARLCRSWIRSLDGGACVAFSPDGDLLAAGRGPAVVVWDAVTGAECRCLLGHAGRITSLAFGRGSGKAGRSPPLLASAGEDGVVKIWDRTTGELLRTFEGPPETTAAVAFGPDDHLAVAGEQIVVREATTGRRLHQLEGQEGEATAVAFRADGRCLASAGSDGAVRIWDLTSGRLLHTLRGHRGRAAGVAFRSDGRLLASCGDDGAVKVWDAAAGVELRTLWGHPGKVGGVAFRPGGKGGDAPSLLASAGGDLFGAGEVRLWDAETGRSAGVYRGHLRAATAVAFHPDGVRLASADDSAVKLWDATNDQEARSLHAHAHGLTGLAVGPDGRSVATAGRDGWVRFWDPATGRHVHALQAPTTGLSALAWSRDGRRLATGDTNKTLTVWDAASRQAVITLQGHTAAIAGLAFHPDGDHLASASRDLGQAGEVKVWDVRTGGVRFTRPASSGKVAGLAFSPDGSLLAGACDDRTVRVWDGATGEEIVSLRGHATPVSSVAFGPDGRFLVSGAGGLGQGEVKAWDLAARQEVWTHSAHTGRVTCVAVSPDGRRLVSAGWDRTVRLWDAATGQAILTLPGHADRITALAFSPDGNWLASGSWDGVVRVWETTPERP